MTIAESLFKAQAEIEENSLFSTTAGAMRLKGVVDLLRAGYKLEDKFEDSLKELNKKSG